MSYILAYYAPFVINCRLTIPIWVCLVCQIISGCKPGVNSDTCGENSIKAVLEDAFKTSEDRPESISRPGGYVRVSYNPDLIESHDLIAKWVQASNPSESHASDALIDPDLSRNIYKQHFCTALIDFITTENGYLAYLWTSRHCIAFPFIEEMKVSISTPNGYISVPFKSEFTKPNKTIGKYLRLDKDAFLSYFTFNKSSQIRSTLQNARLPEASLLGQKHPMSNDVASKIFDHLQNFQLQQEVVFQRLMCNSYNQKQQKVEIFNLEKLCFNAKDLLVISGEIDLSALKSEESQYLTTYIKKSIDERSQFLSKTAELIPLFSLWRYKVQLLNYASYFEKLKSVLWFVESGCPSNFTNLDEGNLCKVDGAVPSIQAEFKRAEEEFTSKLRLADIPLEMEVDGAKYSLFDPSVPLLSLRQLLISYIQPAWVELLLKINDFNFLYLHTNVESASEQVAFKSIDYRKISEFNSFPPIINPFGFVHYLPKGGVKFSKSDSGSLISVGGYYPLVTLSSVNDDEATGSETDRVLPSYQPETNESDRPKPSMNTESKPSSTESKAADDTQNTPPSSVQTESVNNAKFPSEQASIYDDNTLPNGNSSLPSLLDQKRSTHCEK